MENSNGNDKGSATGQPDASADLGWAFGELRGACLGDARLVQRLAQITLDISKMPEGSIPSACNGGAHQAKAAYRFFDNDNVTPEAIEAAHRESTIGRITDLGCSLVLAVQDSTFINFTTHRATTGLGPIGKPDGPRGFIHHGVLAVDAEKGIPLGLLDSFTWVRPEKVAGTAPSAPAAAEEAEGAAPSAPAVAEEAEGAAPSTPAVAEEKESRRWLDALTRTSGILPAGVRMLTVADREADCFEFFDHARNLGEHVLVRVHHDRSVAVGDEIRPLWDAARAAEPLGRITFTVPRDDQNKRPEREAIATLQVASVQLQCPQRLAARHLAPVPACVILLQEIDVPPDQEPVQWLLLTSLAVRTLAEAEQCVLWYSWRWRIERLHFILKSGCNYEKLQLETAERLWRALAIYLIVAWRVLYIDMIGRTLPTAPCTVFLTRDEWQALCCRRMKTPTPPTTPPDCRTAVRWLAQLGGFLSRKGAAAYCTSFSRSSVNLAATAQKRGCGVPAVGWRGIVGRRPVHSLPTSWSNIHSASA